MLEMDLYSYEQMSCKVPRVAGGAGFFNVAQMVLLCVLDSGFCSSCYKFL